MPELPPSPAGEFLPDCSTPAAFMAAPGAPHYETDQETTRCIEWRGVLWAVTYHAEHDGIGWRVRSCTAQPIEGTQRYVHAGESALLRVKVRQDYGSVLQLVVDGQAKPGPSFEAPRSALVGLEWTPR